FEGEMRMRFLRTKLAVAGAVMVLAACGGGSGGDQSTHVQFSSLVSFGDSLSDVGTYRVGAIAAIGGGQFTVNGPAPTNCTERLAADIHVAAPCAAETGLASNIPGIPAVMPPVFHTTCTNYA